MDIGRLLFGYTGRINRAKYWIAVLIYFIATAAIVGFIFVLPFAGMALAVIGYIAMIVSGVMVGIKRLHDRDKSGWWLLLFYLVPGLLSGAGTQVEGMGNAVLSLIGLAITVWMIVELGCLRGTIGPNRFGPDPVPAAAAA
jgi:uncharacterized membrane protein YhaH (DUF805 family)